MFQLYNAGENGTTSESRRTIGARRRRRRSDQCGRNECNEQHAGCWWRSAPHSTRSARRQSRQWVSFVLSPYSNLLLSYSNRLRCFVDTILLSLPYIYISSFSLHYYCIRFDLIISIRNIRRHSPSESCVIGSSPAVTRKPGLTGTRRPFKYVLCHSIDRR